MNQDIKRISFSELKNWKECSYRHKLIHIDKIPYFEGNEFTAFGTAIHEVCEKVVPTNSKDSISVFEKSFLKELKKLKDEGKKLDSSLVSDMRKQAVPICNQVLPEVKSHFGEFEVISVEEQIMEPIQEFQAHGRNFKGFIDMVIKTPDDKYHIIDWKTCSWGWSRDKKSDPITNYQLTYYKNYFSKKHNISPSQIETYFVLLKRTAKSQNVEILRVTSGQKKTENSLKLLENAVINIEKGFYIKNRLNCRYCKFYKTEYCK
jgi:ATP-dependent exoDNAse (exonuclease V) beta subunit